LLPILLPQFASQDLLPAETGAAAYGSTSTRRFVDDLTQTGGDPPAHGARYYGIKVVP
jgi:hypothetical protein